MAHGPEIRTALRSAYVHDRLSLKAACERSGVGYHTGRRWKTEAGEAGDDWDKARSAARLAAGDLGDMTRQVLEDFATMFQSTMDSLKEDKKATPLQKAEAMSRLSDAYAKTMKAAGAADPKLSQLATAMQVLELQAEFVRDSFPQHLDAFVEILEPFGAKITEAFAR